MIDYVLTAAAMTHQYAHKLVADIPADKCACQPAPGLNHPCWVLGHLTMSFDNVVSLLGGQKQLNADWNELFGMGSQPTTDPARYPGKSDMCQKFDDRYQAAVSALRETTPAVLAQPFPVEKMRPMLPTVGAAVVFILTSHAAVHLGQISAWRRMQGMPGVLNL